MSQPELYPLDTEELQEEPAIDPVLLAATEMEFYEVPENDEDFTHELKVNGETVAAAAIYVHPTEAWADLERVHIYNPFYTHSSYLALGINTIAINENITVIHGAIEDENMSVVAAEIADLLPKGWYTGFSLTGDEEPLTYDPKIALLLARDNPHLQHTFKRFVAV